MVEIPEQPRCRQWRLLEAEMEEILLSGRENALELKGGVEVSCRAAEDCSPDTPRLFAWRLNPHKDHKRIEDRR